MKVTGFGKVTGLLVNFSLRKKFGKHGECKFTMSVKDDEATAQLEKVGKTIGVTIGSENPLPVFFGEIKSVTLNRKIFLADECEIIFYLHGGEEATIKFFSKLYVIHVDILSISSFL